MSSSSFERAIRERSEGMAVDVYNRLVDVLKDALLVAVLIYVMGIDYKGSLTDVEAYKVLIIMLVVGESIVIKAVKRSGRNG